MLKPHQKLPDTKFELNSAGVLKAHYNFFETRSVPIIGRILSDAGFTKAQMATIAPTVMYFLISTVNGGEVIPGALQDDDIASLVEKVLEKTAPEISAEAASLSERA